MADHPVFCSSNPTFYSSYRDKSLQDTFLSNVNGTRMSPQNYKAKSSSTALRQTMNMKKYKYQKLGLQSKPILVSNYEEQLLAMQSKKSECLEDYYKPTSTSSRMMPISTSVWVNNNKKMQKIYAKSRKREGIEEVIQTNKPSRGMSQYSYENPIHDLSNYFYSVKNYFAYHKKKVDRERRIRINVMKQERYNLEEDSNLNIVKLKPCSQQYRRQSRRQTINTEQQSKQKSPQMIEYHSVNQLLIVSAEPIKHFASSVKGRSFSQANETKRIFKRTAFKREDMQFIFGEFKKNQTDQQQQKLRVLYYRDFLWKVGFNRGLMFESTQEIHRFYVGKGNNSRLIRRIMAKKPWWSETSQQDNANFIWTQLKIYDVYKNQRSLKRAVNEQTLFISNCDSFVGTIKQVEQAKTAQSRFGMKFDTKQDKNSYVLNEEKFRIWRQYIRKKGGIQKRAYEDMKQRNNILLSKIKITHKITNHLQFSRVIGNKKALYRTMQAYFNVNNITDWSIPLTFHITGGIQNEEYLTFLREYYKKSKQGLNCWIVKPGELSNRGRDIKYCANLQEIKEQIKQKKMNSNGSPRTYIVQLYLDRPFLYQGRKFDLRHYMMITSTAGKIRGYFYQEGYVRTTSYPYSLQNKSSGVHLTNDAIQKYLPNYSKYQKANKLSYEQLSEYMYRLNPQKTFLNTIFPQIKAISKDIMFAAFPLIDPERRQNNFEIFGIDIMIDESYKCWLIEVNTNPCIEVNCSVLANVIPGMLENALAIGLDSLVAPPVGKLKVNHNNYLLQNKFQLLFDEQVHGRQILMRYREQSIEVGNYGDDDDNYQSCEEDDCEN